MLLLQVGLSGFIIARRAAGWLRWRQHTCRCGSCACAMGGLCLVGFCGLPSVLDYILF